MKNMTEEDRFAMRLELREDMGGYAADLLKKADIAGKIIDKPFVFLTGPNGSGKSAILRAIRASVGVQGERGGKLRGDYADIDPENANGDLAKLAGYVNDGRNGKIGAHVPAFFRPEALGWKGQATYLFDSRVASAITSRSDFDDDMAYHVSLIVGGGKNVSHGEFVKKTWWEAIEWALGTTSVSNPWETRTASPARKALLEKILGKKPARSRQKSKPGVLTFHDEVKLPEFDTPAEKWLFIDEPETAIDAETLLVGIAVLLEAAEIGKLRVFCASHSLLFPAGLVQHPKVQTIDLGANLGWMKTQEIALKVAADSDKLRTIGTDLIKRIKERRENSGGKK